ncbi:MAG: hypothetical protein J07HX64_02846 [halophilic archaeon J07HX64]|nr:MAG: hypothetical protein J07HX64_02846 [halophilic archaeon J07HX64]
MYSIVSVTPRMALFIRGSASDCMSDSDAQRSTRLRVTAVSVLSG